MYTTCPECNSVFEITAADLAVAGGFVRCGQCAASFDALSSLSDSSGAPSDPEEQPDDVATAIAEADSGDAEPQSMEPDIRGEEPGPEPDSVASKSQIVELDAPADGPPAADSDPDTADDADQDKTGDEPFTASVDLDNDDDEILLDEDYEPPLIDDEDFFDDEDEDEDTEGQEEADESALFALPLPELTALEPPEHGMLPEKLEGGEAVHEPSAQSQTPGQAQNRAVDAGLPKPATQSPWLRTNDAYDAEDARDLRNYLRAPGDRRKTIAWIAATALMALLLVGQVIHRHRGDLVIHPRFGPVVQSMYRSIGVDLRPNWQISEYEVVGQARLFLMPLDEEENPGSVPGDSASAGDDGRLDATAIRFVAIISNGARLPQPAPLVRLTLRDRWGDATGARTFTPPEYLADRTMIGQLLEPGQRLRVVLNLYDFGSDAVGFDFDMCLPDDSGTLRCAHDG